MKSYRPMILDWGPSISTQIKNLSEKLGLTEQEILLALSNKMALTAFSNGEYEVVKREGEGGMTHLAIQRRDRQPLSHFQAFRQIKNEICGPDREAFELYPGESRLLDLANQYHLWVMPEGVTLPIGFPRRPNQR